MTCYGQYKTQPGCKSCKVRITCRRNSKDYERGLLYAAGKMNISEAKGKYKELLKKHQTDKIIEIILE